MSYEKLFKSGKIGVMEVSNRIVMAPCSTNFGDESDAVTKALIDHYVERAKGGAGLVIVEAVKTEYPMGRKEE